ncbi:MAG: hypothetical protein ACJ768_09205 [Gaiellaceae bacterium]
MDTRAVELLRRASDLIGHGWTQHAESRDAAGGAVDPWQPSATCWSLLGALVAALEEQTDRGDDLPLAQLADALDALALFVDSDSLADWNDDPQRSQDEVIGVLSAAAEAAVPRRLDA